MCGVGELGYRQHPEIITKCSGLFTLAALLAFTVPIIFPKGIRKKETKIYELATIHSSQILQGWGKHLGLRYSETYNGGLNMSNLTIEGWYKKNIDDKAIPLGNIHFYVDGPLHLRLERAEEHLQKTLEPEALVQVDMHSLDLKLPDECGPLSDCHMRVYLHNDRGQFHIVGNRAVDGSLMYTNAILIDQLL